MDAGTLKAKAELTYSYAYNAERKTHSWAVVGEQGGVHIRATLMPDSAAQLFGGRFCGGVECHWRQAPDWAAHEAPSHDHCWLLKGPCWHDGSSLYFDVNIAPLLHGIDGETVPEHTHEYVKSELFDWYREKIDRQTP